MHVSLLGKSQGHMILRRAAGAPLAFGSARRARRCDQRSQRGGSLTCDVRVPRLGEMAVSRKSEAVISRQSTRLDRNVNDGDVEFPVSQYARKRALSIHGRIVCDGANDQDAELCAAFAAFRIDRREE